jgi:hypothetical protein
VALFGGVPDGDWLGDGSALAAAIPKPAASLYYLFATGDPEYAQATACVLALRASGIHVGDAVVSGTLGDASVDFSSVYSYVTTL